MRQISAKIIADSCSSVNGKHITTFELEYPRFIHSELMTHRMFSRNAASSRAIPVATMIEQVSTNPAMPVNWGKNQAGMQAKEELSGDDLWQVMHEWRRAAHEAATCANVMSNCGAHKQIVNRILEPFQMMKTVVTATEYNNWFWLRNHADAQPEIRVLAEKMWEALQASVPVVLKPGNWHVPYFNGALGSGCWSEESDTDTLEDALAISSSCCAQVSYRKLDDSVEKARTIYARLVESEPVHASPFEHQATPMKTYHGAYGFGNDDIPQDFWKEGVTHMDKDFNFWSGNFQSWIQHRQLIPDNVKRG